MLMEGENLSVSDKQHGLNYSGILTSFAVKGKEGEGRADWRTTSCLDMVSVQLAFGVEPSGGGNGATPLA